VINTDNRQYTPLDIMNPQKKMTIVEQNTLVKDIEKLCKEDHMMILVMIRSIEPKVLQIDSSETIFNLKELSDEIRWKLRSFTDMCIDNMKRNELKSNALKEHEEHIANLNTELSESSSKVDVTIPIRNGVTEREKYAEMMKMNSS
jgi:hypothetical protein